MFRNRAAPLLLTGLLFLSCSKSPGEITVELNMEDVTDANRDGIDYFLIVAVPDGSIVPYIYPPECGGRLQGVDKDCYCPSCGYAADEASFQADLMFDIFPADEPLTLYVCGLAASGEPLATGAATELENSPGAEEIVLADASDPEDCNLPTTRCFTSQCPATPTPSATP